MSKFLLVFLFVSPALGAVRNNFQIKLNDELKKPHHLALSAIRSLDFNDSYRELRSLAFSKSEEMPVRWKAFMIMSEISGDKAEVDIKKALDGKEWYMRSAGLTALEHRDKSEAQKWAYTLLRKDPALLVRMKAFEILKSSSKQEVTELFWAKLFSKDSFHNNRSLWIRNDLALHLSKNPRKEDLKHWVRLLHDDEQQFASLAGQALARISNEQVGENTTLTYWKKKFPKTKTL